MTEEITDAAATTALISGNIAQPVLPLTEQLMYSTVRLFNETGNDLHWGTGFLFNLFNVASHQVPVIVTNKHVAEDMGDDCTLTFTGRRPDGGPDLINHITVQITQFKQAWIPHPDVDVVILPVGPFLTELQNKARLPYFVTLDQSLIPTGEELKALLPVEQVLTVGFPGRLWDDTHNLPVFHRGFTASAPYIDFKGERKFLIDITTWPGASGSPVVLYNEGSWMQRDGNTQMGGVRLKLLGIATQVAVFDVRGNVTIQAAPTQVVLPSSMSVPTNLGVCIRAETVLEFEPMLVKKAIVALPPGYVMRAK